MYDNLLQRRRSVGGAPATATPGETPPAGQAQPAPAQQQPAARPAGPGFVAYDRLLAANRPGAQAMAGKVLGSAQQAAQGAQQGIQGAKATFDAATKANTLAFNPANVSLEEARKRAKTAYTGPKTLADAGVDTAGLTDSVAKAQDNVQALGSMGGRAAMLRESYRKSPMTSGGSAMDAALLGTAGAGQISELQKNYGGLLQSLGATSKAATDAYGTAASRTADAAGKYGALVTRLEGQAARDASARAQAAAEARTEAMRPVYESQQRQDGVWTEAEAAALDDIKRGGKKRNTEVP